MKDPFPTRLPPPGEVVVWWWRLDVGAEKIRSLREILSPEERARADRFVHAADGARFTAARSRLRQLLAAHVGGRPEDIDFALSAEGKPRLAGAHAASRLAFNLSHSGGHAAAALIADVEIGIDIEAVRPVEPELAERFFAPAEIAQLRALAPSQWLAGFYRCWTRKEAVLKASGHGLGVPLDSFAVATDGTGPVRVLHAGGALSGAEAWSLLPFAIAPDLPGAVVVASARPHRIAAINVFQDDAPQVRHRPPTRGG
jgi:4'-phosphopantetheinyl transferase